MAPLLSRNLLLLAIGLAACSPAVVTPAPSPPATQPPAVASPIGTPASPTPTIITLRLWVAPQFAPDSDDPAGTIFAAHLGAFEEANPLLRVDVRVKPTDGPSGLLETLSAASAAAPAALPDLISLDPVGLNTAALKGLIAPVGLLAAPPSPPDWFEFAVAAAAIGEETQGLPFATDTMLLAYEVEQYESAPSSWSLLLEGSGAFAFAAADPDASFTLAQYLALGGELTDDAGRPALDPALLSEVLAFYASADTAGALSPLALRFSTSEETWQALQDGQVAAAPARYSVFVDRSSANLAALPIPTRDGRGMCFAEVWSWAVVTQDPVRQALVADQLNWLQQPEFLGRWTQALGLIPPTQDALQSWPAGSDAAVASRLATACLSLPSEEVLATFGPSLREAVEAVLMGGVTPEAAALAAAQKVQNPE